MVRVLYRLRSLSEQAPFDPSTYAYTSPFIDHVIRSGGVTAVGPEQALEQVSLALDIIQFHCGECKYISSIYNPTVDLLSLVTSSL